MSIQDDKDFEALKTIGGIVADCLQWMGRSLEPGITTAELDALGAAFLYQRGATSAPKLVYDFPGATCISVNEEAAHGVPGARVICAGDLVNINVSAELNGYFADTGASFAVPPVGELQRRLCNATQAALNEALTKARTGAKLNQIGKAISSVASRSGFTIIENLGSHGVGTHLHEEPTFIPSYYDPLDRRILQRNQVITIEPFLSTGATQVRDSGDGWTLVTDQKYLTAQYEHTLVIRDSRPYIFTLPTQT